MKASTYTVACRRDESGHLRAPSAPTSSTRVDPRTGALRIRICAAFLALLPLTACNTVEYYEKRAFADSVMEFEDGSTETHWFQKVYYSIEGSAGGIGTSAGGGCGCY